jgi:LPXTG-site transpeptidase (sortase) family protein
MTRPRPALLVLGAGALALGIGTVGIATAGSGMHVESVGARPAVMVEAVPPATIEEYDVSRETPTSPYRTLASVDATQLPRPDRTPRPVGIAIPAIDVRTDVDVVGLDERDQVQVPEDVARTGWYRFSAKPGSGSGSIVIVGHVDGIDQGAGAFYELRELRPGDTVTLTRADDRTVTYEVVAREIFSKSKVPLRELFSRSGSERLTLITCGGAFDPAALEYTDNVVVTAVPVDSDADLGETR